MSDVNVKWHKGPPPHVGWWQASIIEDLDSWRWWNGRKWSVQALSSMTPSQVAFVAQQRASDYWQPQIKWTTFWPEGARVPRTRPDSIADRPAPEHAARSDAEAGSDAVHPAT